MWRKGAVCYIVENNYRVVHGIVKAASGGFCTIRLDTGAMTRLRESRLYRSAEDAAAHLPARKNPGPRKHSPYDYWH